MTGEVNIGHSIFSFYFDKNSTNRSNYSRLNELFLCHQLDYIRDLAKYRGYVYLNQIYELLGIVCDPKCNNPCIEDLYFTVVIGLDDKNDRWTIDIF